MLRMSLTNLKVKKDNLKNQNLKLIPKKISNSKRPKKRIKYKHYLTIYLKGSSKKICRMSWNK